MFPSIIKSVISIWFDEDTGFGNSPTEFMHHMQTSSVLRSEGAITLSRSVRAGLAIKNPIAFVQESKSLINLVCSLLIGAPPEHFFARSAGKSSRKTKYFQETKGVIGHALGYIGVVEDHAKGTLHYPLLIIGGLTPHLLQWFITTREVCQQIKKVLDSIHLSEVPFPYHVAQAVRRVLRGKVMMDITDQELLKGDEPLLNHTNMTALCHDQQIDTGLLHKAIASQVSQQQTHRHMETCKKGVLGRTGCHLSMPFGSLSTTSPVELKPINTDGEANDSYTEVSSNVQQRTISETLKYGV